MASFTIGHWITAVALVLLILGVRKLRHLRAELGDGMGGFKNAMREASDKRDG
jgi:Sec-independent protein translocase protein TatA